MLTYRILIDAVAEAQAEVHALLSSAPTGTVLRQNLARKPVLLGEDLYLPLDVVLGGEHAQDLSLRLKQRYTTDMQRTG